MSDKIPTNLKHRLENLHVKVNSSASGHLLSSLCDRVGGIVHPDIIAVYNSFNGFENEDFDPISMVGVWSIEKILASEEKYFTKGAMPFADFCLDLDIYVCSWSNPSLPVYSTNRHRDVSQSYYDFWSKLLSGTFQSEM